MASIPVRIVVIDSPLSRVTEEPGYFLSLLLLWSSVGSIGYWLFRSLREDQLAREELADAECCRETLQAQMVEARLSALQAQIEPHFLFNTLANVKRLYETVPHQGREMLSSLISYLRAALPSMRQSGSTLGRELDLARSFLTILKMRMGDRLDFSIEVEPALNDAQVPPMVLPTLVENAIKHGLSPLPEGGRIDIAARRDGARPADRRARQRRRVLLQRGQRRRPGQHAIPAGGAVREPRRAVAFGRRAARRPRVAAHAVDAEGEPA